MSDEFLKVASAEIDEELSSIRSILDLCQNDADISKNSDKIEQHMHKIKGLAPMMGKQNVGDLAKTLDMILKRIVAGQHIEAFFNLFCSSIEQMIAAMEKPCDLEPIQKEISEFASKIGD